MSRVAKLSKTEYIIDFNVPGDVKKLFDGSYINALDKANIIIAISTPAINAGTKIKITDTRNGFWAFSKRPFGCLTFQRNGMAIEGEMLIDTANAICE